MDFWEGWTGFRWWIEMRFVSLARWWRQIHCSLTDCLHWTQLEGKKRTAKVYTILSPSFLRVVPDSSGVPTPLSDVLETINLSHRPEIVSSTSPRSSIGRVQDCRARGPGFKPQQRKKCLCYTHYNKQSTHYLLTYSETRDSISVFMSIISIFVSS